MRNNDSNHVVGAAKDVSEGRCRHMEGQGNCKCVGPVHK